MAHFAQIDEATNLVINVCVVADDSILDGDGKEDESVGSVLLEEKLGHKWLQTSYNTRNGVHKTEGKTPLRKNYAGIGFTYHPLPIDGFSPPQPFPSWSLNEETCRWVPPVERPDQASGLHIWNEETQQWDKRILT